MKAVINGLVLSLASIGAFAQSLDERLVMATESIDIKEIVQIPIRNLKAVESEGQILYMSDNGRYVLVGQIYDIWTRKTLDTMDQIRRSTTHLSFKDMNMPIEELNTVSMGQGQSKVVAFVDPKCESCHVLIKQAQGMSDDFTFQFVFVPALGESSVNQVKHISCTPDKQGVADAVLKNHVDRLAVPQDCDLKVFNTTLVAADLMGINGVPFIVAPNGEILRGLPNDLKSWLQERG
ncbi:DsbC family protein [Alcaligenes faecalis]|uniref:DsbC family protein n=1 Tax=Alcaligenes faecalis TaxID=511 RepID=UPI000F662E1B|nr:DsbC family protein [Alcaligenes faecalis]RSE57645.1 DsbC family protein [Alcaligenes faecalis]